MQTAPTFPVQLSVSELEQSMYTLEMCVTSLMESQRKDPMKQDGGAHASVYADLLESSNKMRTMLTNLGVELEPPLYQVFMQTNESSGQQMSLHA